MIGILSAAAVSFLITLFGTPLFIKFSAKHQLGQFIRQDGPTRHYTKRGTPTMGGAVIIFSCIVGYAFSCVVSRKTPGISGMLLIFLMVGMGLVGFFDDFTKIRKKQSLGLKPLTKMIWQTVVGVLFALGSIVQLPGRGALRPASTHISFVKDTGIDLAFAGRTLGIVLFIIWVNFLITAWSNAVNLTDGLDGLATGTSAITFGVYVIIVFWQLSHICSHAHLQNCYIVRGPRDVAMVTAAVAGSCIAFLWWNCAPAKIFMGDTGSLALGGTFAGMSVVTRTELLAVIIGGLFVLIALSDVIQIVGFKLTRKRVFKMAPLHHHFELLGWREITITIRFWLIAIVFAALGLCIFYGVWVVL
jgi:phospho-N-acetylmuramoyl-pentapeptide-transferase